MGSDKKLRLCNKAVHASTFLGKDKPSESVNPMGRQGCGHGTFENRKSGNVVLCLSGRENDLMPHVDAEIEFLPTSSTAR